MLNFRNFHLNISWTVDINMQMSELMMSSPHNFPYILYFVHRNAENPIFQLWECKPCLISTLKKMQNNVCSDIFWHGDILVWAKRKFSNISYTKYMDNNCEAMISSTHSFAYSYRLFKKCSLKVNENSKFHIQTTWTIVRRWYHQLTHLHIHIDCSKNVHWTLWKFKISYLPYF